MLSIGRITKVTLVSQAQSEAIEVGHYGMYAPEICEAHSEHRWQRVRRAAKDDLQQITCIFSMM